MEQVLEVLKYIKFAVGELMVGCPAKGAEEDTLPCPSFEQAVAVVYSRLGVHLCRPADCGRHFLAHWLATEGRRILVDAQAATDQRYR